MDLACKNTAKTKFQVSMTSNMLIMVVCPFYILRNRDKQTDRPLVSWNFQHSPPFETYLGPCTYLVDW